MSKSNVIKKCIHSEQQIMIYYELNRAVVNALIGVLRRPIESRITVGKGLLSDPFYTNRLLSDYIKKIRFLAAVVHSLKPSRSCSVINANQRSAWSHGCGSCFQAQSYDIAADFTHLLQRSYALLLTAFISMRIPNTFPKSCWDDNLGHAHGQHRSSITDEHNELIDIPIRRDADY